MVRAFSASHLMSIKFYLQRLGEIIASAAQEQPGGEGPLA